MDMTQSVSHNDSDIEKNKLLAAVGYLGILCLIPLLFVKTSAYAQFHAKQGLVVLIVSVLLWMVGLVPFLGTAIWGIGSVVLLVLEIMGVAHALRGEYWEMPVLGQYAKQIKV